MKKYKNITLTIFVFFRKFLLISLFAFLIAGCAQRSLRKQSLENVLLYPDPPDTARIQYLTSFSSSKGIEKKRGLLKKYILGEEPQKPIYKPYGAAFYNGKIFLCDLDLEGLEILDLESGKFDYFIPKGMGKLQLPINCAVDTLGNLYVADAKRKQIVVFNDKLDYITSFSSEKDFKPTDVAITKDKVWVSNIINGSIDVFQKDSAHTFLYSFPKKNTENGKLYQPTNLFVSNDKVYVSDFGEFNIKTYTHQGEHLSTIGSYGKNIGQFARPKGITVDRDGNIFVVDAAFENVQIFNEKGELLMFFGGSYKESGGMWLPAKITISYEDISYFQKYVNNRYNLKYVILVTNNFGPDKVNIYGAIEIKSNIKK